MQVETYEIEDASSEASAMANDAAALELIEKLGLTGQSSLLNKDTVTRVPYRAMERTEMIVYKALCDEDVKLENYSADAIPVRVLQVAAHAKETGMFNDLRVWYPKEARIDDPVLVGIIRTKLYPNEPQYESLTRDTFYILARWGKTLLSLEKLEETAVKMCRNRRLNQLRKIATEVQTAIKIAEDTTDLETLAKQARAEIA